MISSLHRTDKQQQHKGKAPVRWSQSCTPPVLHPAPKHSPHLTSPPWCSGGERVLSFNQHISYSPARNTAKIWCKVLRKAASKKLQRFSLRCARVSCQQHETKLEQVKMCFKTSTRSSLMACSRARGPCTAGLKHPLPCILHLEV